MGLGGEEEGRPAGSPEAGTFPCGADVQPSPAGASEGGGSGHRHLHFFTTFL